MIVYNSKLPIRQYYDTCKWCYLHDFIFCPFLCNFIMNVVVIMLYKRNFKVAPKVVKFSICRKGNINV